MVGNCCVPQCTSLAGNKKLYPFPKNKKLYKQWCVILRLRNKPSKWMRVCENHFNFDDFTKYVGGQKRLKPGIYPSQCSPQREFEKLKNVGRKIWRLGEAKNKNNKNYSCDDTSTTETQTENVQVNYTFHKIDKSSNNI